MGEFRLVGPYVVYDTGVVTRGFRTLKPTPRNGYARVCLSIGGKKRYTTVHQLVAQAFLGPCPTGCEVAHINGDRTDNRLANLRYCTRAENEADKVAHGTSQHGPRNTNAKLSYDKADEIRERINLGESRDALSEEFGVGGTAIDRIWLNRTWVRPKDTAQ